MKLIFPVSETLNNCYSFIFCLFASWSREVSSPRMRGSLKSAGKHVLHMTYRLKEDNCAWAAGRHVPNRFLSSDWIKWLHRKGKKNDYRSRIVLQVGKGEESHWPKAPGETASLIGNCKSRAKSWSRKLSRLSGIVRF